MVLLDVRHRRVGGDPSGGTSVHPQFGSAEGRGVRPGYLATMPVHQAISRPLDRTTANRTVLEDHDVAVGYRRSASRTTDLTNRFSGHSGGCGRHHGHRG